MRKLFALGFGVALIGSASAAVAGEHSVGAGYGSIGDGDFAWNSPVISYGYKISDNLAVDVTAQGFGADDGDSFSNAAGVGSYNLELDLALTFRVKGGITTQQGHFLYACAGYAYAEGSGDIVLLPVGGGAGLNFSENDSIDGAVAGVGGDFKISDRWGFEASYQRGLGDLDGGNLWTGTLRYRF